MLASEIAQSLQLDDLLRAEGSTCLATYAETLEQAPETSVELFLRDRPRSDRSQLAGLIAIEMRYRLARGSADRVETYIDRFPDVRHDEEQLLDLIYAEYCARRQLGQPVTADEYYQRFPGYAQQLARLFQMHSLLRPGSDERDWAEEPDAELPDVGDEFLGFRLVRELGRGAFARVFLAEQTSLSNRLVAVKITSRRTIEPQTLARMEHPNIVPVHSVHCDELTGLTAVCTPYQGGVALSDVQNTWLNSARVPTQADEILKAVMDRLPPETHRVGVPAEGVRFPRRKDYVYACVWIMHKIAEALAHAHDRGVCHRDLKPSNVLITGEGQPLLVDFNLAFNEVESEGDRAAFFGGTLPYMPPEQLQALHPGEPGTAADVGPRADIFSLAATIYELLTGRLPFGLAESGGDRTAVLRAQLERRYAEIPSARALSPNVPTDMDLLLAKCLNPSPDRRYETAAQLAQDLRRLLDDRPLRHIGAIPKRQAALKFVRRNRRRLLLSAAVLATVLTPAWMIRNAHLKRVQAVTDKAQSEERLEQFRQQRDDIEKKLPLQPRDAYEYFTRGSGYYRREGYQEALDDFGMALKLGYPYKEHALHYRGLCLARLNRDLDAYNEYSEAIIVNPKYIPAHLGRAMTNATSEQYENYAEAIHDAEQALALAGSDPTVRPEDVFFEAARVYTITARDDASRRDRAVELVIEAVDRGLPVKRIIHDKYLKQLRNHPDIVALANRS